MKPEFRMGREVEKRLRTAYGEEQGRDPQLGQIQPRCQLQAEVFGPDAWAEEPECKG